MKPVPEFSQVHVISDLHMGGAQGFQIFNNGPCLAEVIDQIRRQNAKEDVALVINGDMVDFLAEPGAKYFDPDGAVEKLERIAEDPSFAPVWKSLQRFIKSPNRELIVTLGNHDLELALPWVRERLLDLLSDRNDSARGRIWLAYDGAGFRCRVGKAVVLCVHGNEVDPWNLTDYETLRRVGRDSVQGRNVDAWTPNAGAQMVIDVMNGIKRQFPFVDLLKPEADAVTTLLALDPEQGDKLGKVAATALRLGWDQLRAATGFLSAEDPAKGPPGKGPPAAAPLDLTPAAALSRVAGDVFLASSGGQDEARYAERLLENAETNLDKDRQPLELVAGDQNREYLGALGALWNWATGKPTNEVLRSALDKLYKDRSFDLKNPDETFQRLDQLMGTEVDFLIAGHTHLERALPRKRGSGFYYNTGTWVRRIQLAKDLLQDATQFASVFETFKNGSMKALDDFPGLILRQPVLASITASANGIQGQLFRAAPDGKKPLLTALPDSAFART